ncbi:PilZ domain-containing protein [Hyphomicrobium sp.]|uniref:PilZ domain-containing protein n=1 Tax=Hyphomicrobium sp. TaxID=82 RepID=UPI0039C86CC2
MHRPPRTPVTRPARVELSNGRTVNCQILDLSERGAKLRIVNAQLLPPSFTLADSFSSERWTARVVWTGHRTAGVTLEGASPAAVKPRRVEFGKRGTPT